MKLLDLQAKMPIEAQILPQRNLDSLAKDIDYISKLVLDLQSCNFDVRLSVTLNDLEVYFFHGANRDLHYLCNVTFWRNRGFGYTRTILENTILELEEKLQNVSE